MADDKVYLVVMVVCLDSPLAIQNILEVLKVPVVLANWNHLLLDLIVD